MDSEVRDMVRERDTVLLPSGRVGTVLVRRSVHGQCLIQPHDGTETVVEWTDLLQKWE